MSLIVLLLVEFCVWVAFNRITPFTTPRITIALTVTTVSALVMDTYSSWYQPLSIDRTSVWTFVWINLFLAACISFTHFTWRESVRAHR